MGPHRSPTLEDTRDHVYWRLEQSARLLASDPQARPTPPFRRRGRLALLREIAPTATRAARPTLHRLAGLGLSALLGSLVAMPVLAGPGIAETMAGAASSVTQMINHLPLTHQSDEGSDMPHIAWTPTTTAPPMLVSTPTAAATPLTATPSQLVTATAQPRPGIVLTARPATHGSAVVVVAQATRAPGSTSGEPVREAAQENHGQAVPTAALRQAPSPTPYGAAVAATARAELTPVPAGAVEERPPVGKQSGRGNVEPPAGIASPIGLPVWPRPALDSAPPSGEPGRAEKGARHGR